jgi:hypothetical protein
MEMITRPLDRGHVRHSRIETSAGPAVLSGRWARLTVTGATAILVILGLAWRTLRYALAFPLWGDEAFVAVTVLERDFAGLSRPPEFYQIVPPGFLWCEWLVVRWLGPVEWALRLVPFLAGVASLLVFWRFCRGVTTRRTTLLAVAVLAASFYPVRHAAEVKPYAIDLLVSVMLTSLGWATYRRPASPRRWVALIAMAVVGVWCSYPAVFPAGAVPMVLGARAVRERSGRAAMFWVAYCAMLAAGWGVMYVHFAGPQARAAAFLTELRTWRDAFPPVSQPWRLPWWLIEVHTGMMLAYPQGGHHFGSTLTTLLVIAGCVRIARRRARRPLLRLLLAPLALALAAAAIRRYPYGTSTRVMLYMAPAFCLLAAEGIIALLRLRRRARRGPMAIAGLLAIFPLAGMAHDAAWPYMGYDNVVHRRLARQVTALMAPGDRAVAFNSVTPPPPIPDLMITRWLQRVAVARYYLLRYADVPIRWEPDPRTARPAPGGKLWLIVQRHGDDRFFSEDRLGAYQAILEERLGQPQFFGRFELFNGESWSIWVYRGKYGKHN